MIKDKALKCLDDLQLNYNQDGERYILYDEYIKVTEHWLQYLEKKPYDAAAFLREFRNIKYDNREDKK